MDIVFGKALKSHHASDFLLCDNRDSNMVRGGRVGVGYARKPDDVWCPVNHDVWVGSPLAAGRSVAEGEGLDELACSYDALKLELEFAYNWTRTHSCLYLGT